MSKGPSASGVSTARSLEEGKLRLKNYITVALALIFISLLFFLSVRFLFNLVLKREIDWVSKNELSVGIQAAMSIESVINKIAADVRFTAALPEIIQQAPRKSGKRLKELYTRIDQFADGVGLLDANGNVIAEYPEGVFGRLKNGQLKEITGSLTLSKPTISEPFSIEDERWVVALSIPIIKSDSTYQGEVVTLLKLKQLSHKFIKEIRFVSGSYGWLVSDSGNFLYHPTEPIGKSVYDLTEEHGLKDLITGSIKGKKEIYDYHFGGVRKIAAIVPANILGRTWSVGVAIPYKEIIGNLNVFRKGLEVVFLFIVFLLFALFVLYQRLRTKKKRVDYRLVKIEELNQLYHDMIENVDYAVFILDKDRKILSYNNYFAIFSGYEEKGTKSIFKLLPFMEDYRELYGEVFNSGVQRFTSFSTVYKGEERYFELKMIPLFGYDGEVQRVLSLIREVTHQKRLELELKREKESLEKTNEFLRRLAITDELTGINNYRYFKEEITTLFKQAKSRHQNLALLVMDLDNFKVVNDRLGHLAGDAVLKDVARFIRGILPDTFLVARYGGDEFVIVMPGYGKQRAVEQADIIRSEVAREFTSKRTKAIHLTISGGLAFLKEDMKNVAEFIRAADRALYKAKNEGKDIILSTEG